MKSKKFSFLLMFALLFSLPGYSSDKKGIDFLHEPWNVVLQKAQSEGKLIFVDFYTQWCGPCLSMAEDVFTLPPVYSFYNSTFISAKIDAETGEGIELAKRYNIHSYPTYLFIDPKTGEAVHRSSSRQSPDQFIYTGESALIPERRSFYLEKEYPLMKNNAGFLANYIEYKASIYQRECVREAFGNLAPEPGSLKDPFIWNIFDKHITGIDNIYIKEVSDNYNTYVSLFGKSVVDGKLARESLYASFEELEKLCDFEGKYTIRHIVEMNTAAREQNYQKCSQIIEEMIQDPKVDKNVFINSLKFTIKNLRLETFSKELAMKYAGYFQYIAYNNEDRKDPYIHQEYAALLEQIIRTMPDCREFFPTCITDKPQYGKDAYTMRDNKLKPKPIKK